MSDYRTLFAGIDAALEREEECPSPRPAGFSIPARPVQVGRQRQAAAMLAISLVAALAILTVGVATIQSAKAAIWPAQHSSIATVL